MLENKRERLKTFLRKIDEKAIFRIKHFMKESYPVESGGLSVKKESKKVKTRKALSLEEAQLELQQQNRNLTRQAPVRSQTFDVDRSFEKTEGGGSQSSFIKHNKTFHKLFPDIPESEDLLHAYICALQKEVLYHGRLYVTEHHACFHSSVLLKDTKLVIPVTSVHIVKKQNTALLVPNALSIRTIEGEKYLFVSLRNREACYKLLRSVCSRLEDGSANSSPLFSSTDNSFDQGKLVNSSQSSLDQLDGSDPKLFLDSPPPNPHIDLVPQGSSSSPRSTHTQQSDGSLEDVSGGSWVWSVTEKARSLLIHREASSLNTLLFIYLILVVLLLLSSGYIGLRIVALEEQLTSLGALPEFSLQSRYKDTTMIGQRRD
ncbi:GRAM domain-containing protein 2B-like isoform X3 [Salvelinus fontinalis]|uniref:GRAM domain-containing protein 2B-like isoform X3 n=1 Tax=Salvelinus fontinalis TaxID=8038 RepID=UPI002485E1CF|nr:GRAM domain-containing protein 2B-like isoform X3 [Salvelinus fontinalis]